MSNLGGGLRTVDWTSQKISHFEKNFYIEDKRVTARSEKDIEEFRRKNEMRVCFGQPAAKNWLISTIGSRA